ncbi:alcohol dehydrogenase [Leptodontidium sp. MPI-SDFR-AT-0119]|nr:alcohol dehydrogenase [Leptodontidium sp. MPI-SDFR-AT-0119]
MRAVAQLGIPFEVSVIDVPVPRLQYGTDAIVRIDASAICGSDLHPFRAGAGSPTEPHLIGHEAIGYISEIGDAVQFLNIGDYVVIPCNNDDGHYTGNPDYYVPEVNYGGSILPGMLSRVPFADNTLVPIPLNASSDVATMLDYMYVGDIFATAWDGLGWSDFKAGDTVAIFGAGPVGLLTAYSAILRGAAQVYIVDRHQSRLDLAESIGAIGINFLETDPVQEIIAREPNGVRRGIECVGFEAQNEAGVQDSSLILKQLVNVTATRGGISVIGIFNEGMSDFNIGTVYNKGISVGTGYVWPLNTASELVALISAGVAKPNFITSSLIGIEEAPEYFQRFERGEEFKVVIIC